MVNKEEYMKSNKILNLPQNLKLPFFAYGLLKPDQLSFYKIHDLIKKHQTLEIKAQLYLKDGILLLKPDKNTESLIQGELYYFKPEHYKEAYDRIRTFEPKKFYKWQEVTLTYKDEKIKANILAGKNIENAKKLTKTTIETNDPYFDEALKEIESIIKEDEKNQKSTNWINSNNIQHIFRLQMAYLLLWTSIKRFSFIKYPLTNNLNDQYKLIAKEPAFQKTLKTIVKEKRQIYSSNYLNESILDPNNPEKSLNYYHTLRFYGAQKETIIEDYQIIKSSLNELLIIFKEILKYSKHEFE